MRDLTTEEMGHVYGAGGSCSPQQGCGGGNKGTNKGTKQASNKGTNRGTKQASNKGNGHNCYG